MLPIDGQPGAIKITAVLAMGRLFFMLQIQNQNDHSSKANDDRELFICIQTPAPLSQIPNKFLANPSPDGQPKI